MAQTPGALAEVPIPQGWMAQHQPGLDVLAVGDRQGVLLAVGVAPKVGLEATVRAVVATTGMAMMIGPVETTEIRGVSCARASVQQYSRVFAIDHPELDLVIIASDSTGKVDRLDAHVEAVATGTKLTPASLPPGLFGRFQASGAYSGPSPGIGVGVSTASFVELLPDGSLRTSAQTLSSGPGSTGMAQSSSQGWWQVRGNRLLSFMPPPSLQGWAFGGWSNRAHQVFSNGVELYEADGSKTLWTRA